jgi:enoyl-CoA hydratase/carnithine racemase
MKEGVATTESPAAGRATPAELLWEVRNRIGFVTLNRPAALNALSLGMIHGLRERLAAFASDDEVLAVYIRGAGQRAFCAGGDIRSLYQSVKSGAHMHEEFVAYEYPLDYFLHRYPKPYVARLDGITMGAGMGIAQGAKFRLVGDRTRLAMPEVAIGFFPDVGGGYFLSRLRGALGPYLALTGAQLGAFDAIWSGLADAYLAPDAAPQLETRLLEMGWGGDPHDAIASVVRSLATHAPAPAGPAASLAELLPAIDAHFAAASVAGILDSLQGETRPEFRAWATETRALLLRRSPTMLCVSLEQLRRARSLDLAGCFRMEFDLAQHCFGQGDFVEGVRAVIVDKDNAPQWRPGRIEDVSESYVAALFQHDPSRLDHPLADLEQSRLKPVP